jgi:transposase
MPDGIRWVGLDVHARESTVAIFDQETGELSTRRVVGRPHELLPVLREIARPARIVYEAGPTGCGLARRARADVAAGPRTRLRGPDSRETPCKRFHKCEPAAGPRVDKRPANQHIWCENGF